MGALMAARSPICAELMDYGVGTRALGGMPESGDLHLVQSFAGGLLVAVADGLGHGHEAALAARTAMAVLAGAPDTPLLRLVEQCHRALKTTRGVVLSLASFDARLSTMTWLGVGNVEGVLMRAGDRGYRKRDTVELRGGIVGHRLPPLRASTVEILPGDVLVLATDGIRFGFAEALKPGMAPQDMAQDILSRYGKTTDDALVLVGRWRSRAEPGGVP